MHFVDPPHNDGGRRTFQMCRQKFFGRIHRILQIDRFA